MTVWQEAADRLGTLEQEMAAAIARLTQRITTLEETVASLTPTPPPPATARALIEAAGFTGQAADIALGVAYAESGGYTDAVGDYWQIQEGATLAPGDTLTKWAREWHTSVTAIAELNNIPDPNRVQAGDYIRNPTFADPDHKWGPSVGMFQIRVLRDPYAWGFRDRVRDIEKLRDPAWQAHAAYTISQGGASWGAWSVYTNGRYLPHVGKDFPLLTGHPEADRWNMEGTR